MWIWLAHYNLPFLEFFGCLFADCENGDIRLVGGNLTNEGTIEVCFDNLWGLIDETGWTSKDAEVVCRQLGYAVEGMYKYDILHMKVIENKF